MTDHVLRGYAEAAENSDLIRRFESISPMQLYEPVIDLMPISPSRIVDIGAGTGRDAAWLAGMGHHVLAVEPVDELRRAGMAMHPQETIEWLDDRLPDLAKLRELAVFDMLLLSGVWQHLDRDQRDRAVITLARLAAAGGVLIMSLRHGPGAVDRPVHNVIPEDTIEAALQAGFSLLRRRQKDSIQAGNRAAGVHWTWLAFSKL
jgi:SAM-dependent methyltransferase